MKKYYIGKSKINGKGIFTNREIKQGETIFIYQGKKVKSINELWSDNPNWLQVSSQEWIDPGKKTGGYLNHSCNPSAGIKGSVTIVAMRDLKKDEEVTLDYAMSETEPEWKMKCFCGSKNCRKIIKPHRWLPTKLKKKYQPYTSRYIKNKS